MFQIDEKRKGEAGKGLSKVQRKQTWGSQRAEECGVREKTEVEWAESERIEDNRDWKQYRQSVKDKTGIKGQGN